MNDKTYTSKKAAQAAARQMHGKDYAKRYEVQQVELGVAEWVILEKPNRKAETTAPAPEQPVTTAPVDETAPVVNTAQPAPAEAVVPAPKKEPKPRLVREERNGVRRPNPGGLCAAVWEYLDQHGNTDMAHMRTVAAEKGWNVNNVAIEFYQWRKFNGIAGRQPKTATPAA